MKTRFSGLNLKGKLRAINITITGSVFLLATIVLVTHLWLSERSELLRNTHITARLMAQNSAPAVQFGDVRAATDLIGALTIDSDVVGADIVGIDGLPFVSYRSYAVDDVAWPGPDIKPLPIGESLAHFHLRYLDVSAPVSVHGELIGIFLMRVDLASAYRRLAISTAILLLSSLAGIGLAILLLNRRQGSVLDPLSRLLDTMHRVSLHNDYTQRAEITTNDETGLLGQAFNLMITQIEERDRALEHELAERGRAEDLLRRSEARLRLAQEGAGAGTYEWNIETGQSVWSDELWTLYGLEPDGIASSYEAWQQTVHPDDLALAEQVINAAIAEAREFEAEWRVNLPPGEPTRWLMSRGHPWRNGDGKVVRYIGIAIDISGHKRDALALEEYRDNLEEMVAERTAELSSAEAEQRRLNRALRLLGKGNLTLLHARNESTLLNDLCRLAVEAGGYLMAWVGIAEHDESKSIRVAAQSGYEEGYLENIKISWDGATVIGRGSTGTAFRTATTQINQNCWTNEQMLPWRVATLNRGYHSSAALPLVNEGQLFGVLTIYAAEMDAFNPDELKLLEELAGNMAYGLQALQARSDLNRHQQQLEQLVAERTQEIVELVVQLETRAQEAEAANRAKSDFLATMSHEIRTPLNAVVGLTGMLVESPLDRRQRDCANKIQLSAKALRTLIDDILDFSKIEAGALQLEQAPFSLNAILRTTSAVLSISKQDKPIEALFDVAGNVPDALVGDALRLQQILLNLCSNAAKFTEAGEIVLSVSCLAVLDGQATLRFSVRDTGIGIPPGQLEQIFAVFVQVDNSTCRKYGGTGLGLAISSRFVEMMGGHLVVDSSLGQGSDFSFSVILPIDQAKSPAEPAKSLTELSILIIDDHPLARQILQRTCVNFGWKATTLASGMAGLDELQSSSAEGRDYDLVLLDWRMPGMDGLEMLRQAQSIPGLGLPLVLLMAATAELEEALAASDDIYVDGIVAKPVTPASLFEAVESTYSGNYLPVLPIRDGKSRRLAGVRLLVAEDNEINRQVVEHILIEAGAEVRLTTNGLAAVEALRQPGQHFDAVLMDIQMPVMDGYTATRVIREELGMTDLPIIAVTAYALQEDREKSRRLGMAGHIVKPIDVDDLLDIIAQKHRLAEQSVKPEPVKAIPDLVLPGFDPAALQAFGGDEIVFGSVLQQFSSHHQGDVLVLRDLYAAGDIKGASKLAHELAGVSSFLRATEFARLAIAIERQLGEDNAETLLALLDELQAAMLVLVDSIKQFTAQHPAA